MEDLETNPACLQTRVQVVSTSAHPMAFSLNSSMDGRRLKPPNKKKFEEELEDLTKQIKEKESLQQTLPKPGETPVTELRDIRAEKDAAIVKRKKIDSDLKLLNQEITKKMGLLSNTESNLHYKNEAKIDDAIKKLEWQLKVQNFKLSEEKKVVAEIDKLKRSKKHLTQYFAQKKEIDEMRDRQRRMREEREYYFKNLSNLKSKEEDVKKSNFDRKEKAITLKKEIDELYEKKRKIIADFRKEETEYNRLKQGLRIRQRREREEERKALEEAFQKEIEEYQAQKEPFEDEKNLCNTLINYLQRFSTGTADDCLTSPRDETTPESSLPNLPGPAQELEDGKYILLKKNEDCESYAGAFKRPNRRSRKGRKVSVTKQLTHTPQIFAQFASLNLNAPANVSEITASIEQLQARKCFYEEQTPDLSRSRILHLSGSFSSSGSMSSMESPMWERQSTWGFVEVPPAISEHQTLSDAGTSGESGFHDMSRQASKTESSESAADIEAHESIMNEIILVSNQFSPLKFNAIDQDSQSQNSSEETLHEHSYDHDQALDEKEISESCNKENHSSPLIEESKGDKSLNQDDCKRDVHTVKTDKQNFDLNDSKKQHIKSEHPDKANSCKTNILSELFSSDQIDMDSVQSNVGMSQPEEKNQNSLITSSESFISGHDFPQVCSSDYRTRHSSIDSSDSQQQDSEIMS
ncbi:hypothetical protein CHS0354_035616 [Potamilus streckersoni]|uniref:Uncharacterized protein n=1 Tax=Potamilus streckersoni TaxID=2493646 RepID=A0AAE0VIX0_9BIVA|nr:hypothetical protein CHS0354_035616 [Potamilus streckersoni]